MGNEGGPDLEKEAQVSEVMSILEKAPRDEDYVPDRERQGNIIRNLPDDLIYELRGHLHAAYKEQKYFEELRGEPGKPFDDKKILRGELFEILCERDKYLGGMDEASQEFLALTHDPERFRLGKSLGHVRNADMAKVEDTKEGRVVITEIKEAKLGLLDKRAARQLFLGEEKRGVTAAVEVLNEQKEKLTELGLTHLAEERALVPQRLAVKHGIKVSKFQKADFIEVADDLSQVLLVPANRRVEDPESLFHPNYLSEIHSDDREGWVRGLFNGSLGAKVTVQKAAFSTQEVAALVEYLAPQIPEISRN